MDIGAIILSGGKSSRFGEDKGLFEFNGKSLVEYSIATCRSYTSSLVLVSDNAIYSKFGLPLCADIYENCGPMGGIHSGLKHSLKEVNLVVSNDTPFVESRLIELLMKEYNGEDVLITQSCDGRYQTLVGLYNKRIVEPMETELKSQHFKMIQFIKQTDFRIISLAKEQNLGDSFVNFNYLKELQSYEY
ncbi:MAG: hypothetical protein B7C24_07540 [Bacteroidetes bacterium 4572_77]|nr:MAG: hypothetical protein B7C24_07540 [Bacteroidetes bacterium 4572_77]